MGFALARWVGASAKTLTHVVFYALLPCFAFRLLTTSASTGPQFGRMILLAVLVMAAMALVGTLTAFALRLTRPETSVFLLVVMFSNGGNYGLPAISFAFGEEALSYGTVFFLTGSVLTNTVGAFLAAAGRRSLGAALMSVLRMPALYGIAAAAVTLGIGLTVPTPIMRAVNLLSDATLPLMILVLGMQLERASTAGSPGAGRGSGNAVARHRAACRARPHIAPRRHGRRTPGGGRPCVDARRSGHHDSCPRVRRLTGFRHRCRFSLDTSQPVYPDAAHRIPAIRGRARQNSVMAEG